MYTLNGDFTDRHLCIPCDTRRTRGRADPTIENGQKSNRKNGIDSPDVIVSDDSVGWIPPTTVTE